MCKCFYQENKDEVGIDAKVTDNSLNVIIRYEQFFNIQHIEINCAEGKIPIKYCPFCGEKLEGLQK